MVRRTSHTTERGGREFRRRIISNTRRLKRGTKQSYQAAGEGELRHVRKIQREEGRSGMLKIESFFSVHSVGGGLIQTP